MSRSKAKVLLLHHNAIMHYRISTYNYLYNRFKSDDISFTVASSKDIKGNATTAEFPYYVINTSYYKVMEFLHRYKPDVIILFSGLRNFSLFPIIISLKILGIPCIYWGHGINLQNKRSYRKLYSIMHYLSDSIILYAEHLKQYVNRNHHNKTFIANNTLNLPEIPLLSFEEKRSVLRKYGIETTRNVIFVGRIQKRKRIPDLLNAMKSISNHNYGTILVGSSNENIISVSLPQGLKCLPALYGTELLSLMVACDLYCCPGAVGLNIVDAFACSLPFVTEHLDNHGPEIMYLEDGINGMIVPFGNIKKLSVTIQDLLSNDALRLRMGKSARHQYETKASLENMYKGFHDAVNFVLSTNC
ncbi:MAG: glycosyltransferase family 4 protein [Candidatus Thorarchaeota archaeon]